MRCRWRRRRWQSVASAQWAEFDEPLNVQRCQEAMACLQRKMAIVKMELCQILHFVYEKMVLDSAWHHRDLVVPYTLCPACTSAGVTPCKGALSIRGQMGRPGTARD